MWPVSGLKMYNLCTSGFLDDDIPREAFLRLHYHPVQYKDTVWLEWKTLIPKIRMQKGNYLNKMQTMCIILGMGCIYQWASKLNIWVILVAVHSCAYNFCFNSQKKHKNANDRSFWSTLTCHVCCHTPHKASSCCVQLYAYQLWTFQHYNLTNQSWSCWWQK